MKNFSFFLAFLFKGKNDKTGLKRAHFINAA